MYLVYLRTYIECMLAYKVDKVLSVHPSIRLAIQKRNVVWWLSIQYRAQVSHSIQTVRGFILSNKLRVNPEKCLNSKIYFVENKMWYKYGNFKERDRLDVMYLVLF